MPVCVGAKPLGLIAIGMSAGAIRAHWATASFGIAGLMSMALTRRYWRSV